MQFAKLNNLNIHFQEIGAPEGKPLLVFINSLGTDFRIWRDVIIRFVGEAQVLTYDKRGHGLSDVGSAPYTIEDHASDLAALLDHLGKRNAILVGLSVGGLIAQALYKTRPDLVSAMVLSDTALRIGTPDMWADRIRSIDIGGMDSLADATMTRWFTPEFRQKRIQEVAGYRTMVARQPIDGYLGTCSAIRDADYTADAAAISVPVMCIVGEEDIVTTPAHVYDMAAAIKGARLKKLLCVYAHFACIEKPDTFANLVKDFIRTMNEQMQEIKMEAGSQSIH
ncbi:MAG: 3-oxoadipate enol-lactonase [Ahrensia sp.]|nr:3-oxoadipate enol-lactonase [Ahrensia sp.]